jgi:hypothetical protein
MVGTWKKSAILLKVPMIPSLMTVSTTNRTGAFAASRSPSHAEPIAVTPLLNAAAT